MSELTIRKMQTDDLDEVCRIEADSFSNPWSKKSFSDSLMLDFTIFITALWDNQIVGYLGAYYLGQEIEIVNIAVEKMHREKGIGSELLKYLLAIKHETLGVCCLLEVRKSNSKAIELYKKFGFTINGCRKDFYEKPREDAYVMVIK